MLPEVLRAIHTEQVNDQDVSNPTTATGGLRHVSPPQEQINGTCGKVRTNQGGGKRATMETNDYGGSARRPYTCGREYPDPSERGFGTTQGPATRDGNLLPTVGRALADW